MTNSYSSAQYVSKVDTTEDGTPIFTFRITNDTLDRQGEVVTMEGWNFSRYMTNPIVLDSHQYNSIEAIVGRCLSIDRDANGWNAQVRFNGSEYGCLAQQLVEAGDLRAVSVGFKPVTIEYPDIGSLRAARTIDADTAKQLVTLAADPALAIHHTEKELLEISVVPIPANPEAIRLRSVEAVQKISVPSFIRTNAQNGLEWYDQGLAGDGVTRQTVNEAKQMAAGTVTDDKAKRMAAWFARHMADLDSPDAQPGSDNYPSPGVVAHALWGGGSKSSSQRAMNWAAQQAPASASLGASFIEVLSNGVDSAVSDTLPTGGSLGYQEVWLSVASAMYVLLHNQTDNEPMRHRLYVSLKRTYELLNYVPPDYITAPLMAQLSAEAQQGWFWHQEDQIVKADLLGQTRAVSDQIKQAYDHIGLGYKVLGDMMRSTTMSVPPEETDQHDAELAVKSGINYLQKWLETH